jgi:DNA-binding transcriptional LysR family regulator
MKRTLDLNDLRYFGTVVDTGGFSAAALRLGVPKSRVSRRVAALEAELGVRLMRRTTRRIAVTPVGAELHRHVTAMLEQADAAQGVALRARSEPAGPLRVTCPDMLAQSDIARLVALFSARHPLVRIQLWVTNRRIDLVQERVDVALRVREPGDEDPRLAARYFSEGDRILVATPAVCKRTKSLRHPADLAAAPCIVTADGEGPHRWRLQRDGEVAEVTLDPRIVCSDTSATRAAALAGGGIALLPSITCASDLREERLQRVLPQWATAFGRLHAAYLPGRGLLPAVSAFIDFIGHGLAQSAAQGAPRAARRALSLAPRIP